MKHILIVEDEPDIQELLRTYLEDAGYQTAVAGTAWRPWPCSGVNTLTWFSWT